MSDPDSAVVIGASAGGIEALTRLLHGLSGSFPAPILVVMHLSPHSRSVLPEILTRAGPLPARHPESGEVLRPGEIYVAPPNRHLLVRDHRVYLDHGPRVNRSRPAIDPLFESAAKAFGHGTIGILLSGNLGDGSVGLEAIRKAGGTVIVQSPEDALHPGMPRHALDLLEPDHVVGAAEMPAILTRLLKEDDRMSAEDPERDGEQLDLSQDELISADVEAPLDQLQLSCPDCGGVLAELREGKLTFFRCHVVHRYSVDALLVAKTDEVDAALWTAVRALRERAAMNLKLADRFAARGHEMGEARMRALANRLERDAERVRSLIDALE